MKTKKLYKFLRTGLKSENGEDRDWKIGEWRKEEEIDICKKGFHASKTPLQVIYSTFHDALTQVCFGCLKVRSTIKR